MITLLQSADESTFVHESGHYFLDVMTDVAGKDGTPSQVRADVQTIMDWFGIKDLDEWNSLSLERKRQYHEQFARGFEQYLREGEAPSEGLRHVFQTFKEWLQKIYRSSQEVGVEITPEVRAAFDRMLATDKEIAVKAENDVPTMFSTMENVYDIAECTLGRAIDGLFKPQKAKTAI